MKPSRRFALSAAFLLATLPGLSTAPAQTAPPDRPAPAPTPGQPDVAGASHSALPDFAVNPVQTVEGQAAWYDVPENSLPQRRAWTEELTAASNKLPLNSYARVRRLDGGGEAKPIVVRITDNGIHGQNTLIDVDRPAAQALGMVKAGEVRVRVEQLALRNATAEKPVEKKELPATPKASEVSGTPAVSQQAEKAASEAKVGPKP